MLFFYAFIAFALLWLFLGTFLFVVYRTIRQLEREEQAGLRWDRGI